MADHVRARIDPSETSEAIAARAAQRGLRHALDDAVRHGVVPRNVAKLQPPPRVQASEMVTLDRDGIATILTEPAGHEMDALAIVGLFTGMRLGEVVALRWLNVDLGGKVIKVREAIEETEAHGLQVKAPKTRAGRRDIGLPEIVLDALVFPTLEGSLRAPSDACRAWGLGADAIGMPEITVHGLRYAHAAQLIDVGVDIVTIRKRLGHTGPDVTLRVYAHLFRRDDDKAAAAINAALAGAAGS